MKFAEQNEYKVLSHFQHFISPKCMKFVCVCVGVSVTSCLFSQVFFVESVCEDPNIIAENIVVSDLLIS